MEFKPLELDMPKAALSLTFPWQEPMNSARTLNRLDMGFLSLITKCLLIEKRCLPDD